MAEQDKSKTENIGSGGTGSSSGAGATTGGQTTGAAGSGGASTKTAVENSSLTNQSGSSSSGSSAGSGAENSGTLSNVSNKVKGLYQTASESQVGQAAKDALGQVKENASTTLEEKKTDVARGLTSVADTIRQVGDSVKPTPGEPANKVAELTTQYTDTLAQQVEKISGYLEDQDLRGMMRDLEGFARRNPAVFLGGAFALGILAARFLKSSKPSNEALMRRSDAGNFGRGSLSAGNRTGGGRSGVSTTGKTSVGGPASDTLFNDRPKSVGGDADSVRQFNSGTAGTKTGGSGSGSSTGTTGSTGVTGTTGTTGAKSSGSTGSSTNPTPSPSKKTEGDFGSSKF